MKPSSTLSPPTIATQEPRHPSDYVLDDIPTRKTRSGVSPAKDHAIKQAHKVAAKRERHNSLPYVWVGNLDLTITEAKMEELFATCGKIHRVSLRRAGAWTAKPHEATQYACVEFRTYTGKANALKLHGYMHDSKRRLIVCIHPTGLPEFEQTVQSSFDLWDAEKAENTKAEAIRYHGLILLISLASLTMNRSPDTYNTSLQ
ncbi:Embryonic polyadenylate-binding protein 2-A [Marasmius tenuissimus]|uniref:Embryonic polyadenylate-binding protein 2-A n=1 Tax=Marasmius tenuissimus TaxID=585030 RepID=A0ABR3AB87_9AGAR